MERPLLNTAHDRNVSGELDFILSRTEQLA